MHERSHAYLRPGRTLTSHLSEDSRLGANDDDDSDSPHVVGHDYFWLGFLKRLRTPANRSSSAPCDLGSVMAVHRAEPAAKIVRRLAADLQGS